jgi:hypothetical protein
MHEHEYTERDIARILRRSPRYVSARMNNHAPWPLDECYRLLALFSKPKEMLPVLFPEHGRYEPMQLAE